MKLGSRSISLCLLIVGLSSQSYGFSKPSAEEMAEFKAACKQDVVSVCNSEEGRAAFHCLVKKQDQVSQQCQAQIEKITDRTQANWDVKRANAFSQKDPLL